MIKEVASYEKEAKDNEARVQKMRDAGKDPYDIKKQEEVGQTTSAEANTLNTYFASISIGHSLSPMHAVRRQ